MAPRLLIVRLGALGDLVHTLPTLAALRRAWPDATIDWLVDARYAGLLPFVSGYNRVLVLERTQRWGGVPAAVRAMRAQRYDAALDLQGLLKSGVLARLSGAPRVVGFSSAHLRERAARLCYTEVVEPEAGVHVVHKNLAVARHMGAAPGPLEFALSAPMSTTLAAALPEPGADGRRRFAVVNPGAGWPNKRWPAERFGAVAAALRSRHGLPSMITWGPGEEDLARRVADHASGAARLAPPTALGDLIALLGCASLFVGGDTGPLQLAAALGVPIVSMFGPTNPARNGSWVPGDIGLSRFDQCECHHKRRCRRPSPCIDEITVADVTAAIDRRLTGGIER
jgi:heptosyltransferase I